MIKRLPLAPYKKVIGRHIFKVNKGMLKKKKKQTKTSGVVRHCWGNTEREGGFRVP
jgi:hypothetical protein